MDGHPVEVGMTGRASERRRCPSRVLRDKRNRLGKGGRCSGEQATTEGRIAWTWAQHNGRPLAGLMSPAREELGAPDKEGCLHLHS